MYYVLIIHEVNNYSKWKIGFDKAASIRKEAGELEYQVLQDQNIRNKVVHFSKWSDHEKAKVFFESDAVKQIRAELGVQQPDFIYLNQVDKGIL